MYTYDYDYYYISKLLTFVNVPCKTKDFSIQPKNVIPT